MRTTMILMTVLAAGCASAHETGAWARAETPDPRVEKAARRIRELEDRDREMRRELAWDLLRALPENDDGDARRHRLARIHSLGPDVLVDLPPATLASLAPDVLRVYDLGAVLDTGPDAPETLRVPGTDDADGADAGGKGARLRRLAALLRERVVGVSWPADATFVLAEGETLAVLQHPDAFARVESALDDVASVGGPPVRVRVAVRGAPWTDEAAWTSASPDEVASALGADVDRALVLDVPWGRAVGARRTVSRTYLQDYEMDARSTLGDPCVGSVDTGLAVTATSRGGADGNVVDVRVQWAECAAEMPTFTTLMASGTGPVRIEIPQARVWTSTAQLAPAGETALVLGPADDPLAAIWIDEVTGGTSSDAVARPAWRRVAPGDVELRESDGGPLLANAYALASAYLDGGRADDAAATLESALRASKLSDYTRRVHLGPERVPTIVVVRRVAGASDDLEGLLAGADVGGGPSHAFLSVRDGFLAAALDPESKGDLDRALGAVRRASGRSVRLDVAGVHDIEVDGAMRTDSVGNPGRLVPGLSASWSFIEQMSFIQDFDLEVAHGHVVADPIIGVLQEGVTLDAVAAAPGDAAAAVDVRVVHVRVARPIRTFTTSLGAGPDVTIQFPELEVTVLPARVEFRVGERSDLVARFGSGAAAEPWTFHLSADER